jgi:hypothetical protein
MQQKLRENKRRDEEKNGTEGIKKLKDKHLKIPSKKVLSYESTFLDYCVK